MSGLPVAAVVLDVNHRPVADIEHLIEVLPGLGEAHGNDDLVGGTRFHIHLGVRRFDPRLAELGDLTFEDLTGLLRPVSKRRRPMPGASRRSASPVNLPVEHRHELPRLALEKGPIGIPDAIGLRFFHRIPGSPRTESSSSANAGFAARNRSHHPAPRSELSVTRKRSGDSSVRGRSSAASTHSGHLGAPSVVRRALPRSA